MATTIFGTEEFASKIQVEDCRPIGEVREDLATPRLPKILSSPKPTSYQHYLEQPGLYTNWSQQVKWDRVGKIRGFKQYWHRETSSTDQDRNSWMEDPGKPKTKSHTDPINPVTASSRFSGRIRFDNLSEIELGALLFALDLPEGCLHKLGMGKPLGLGSVKITPSLHIINRSGRYSKLFEGNAWHSGKHMEPDLNKYKDAFALFIGQETQQAFTIKDATSYWTNNQRMQALKTILTYEHDMGSAIVDWIDRTRYMALEEFKKHPILPKPSEVLKESMYKKR